MKIHHSAPERQFTIMPNDTLRDKRLSYLTRGVLAEILSRPDDWSTNADAIAARAHHERGKPGEGRRAIRAAFRELKDAGYLYRLKCDGPRGQHVTELHIFDAPQECDERGVPLYFAVLAHLADVPDGGTSVPPASMHVPAGRADVPVADVPVADVPVAGVPPSGTSLRRPIRRLITKTDNEDQIRADEHGSSVTQSPVPVEGNGAGEVKFDFFTREGTDEARQAAHDALGEWERQQPEAAP